MLEASSDPRSLLGWAPIRECGGRRQNPDCDRGRRLIERTGGGVRWPYHFFLASDAAALLFIVHTCKSEEAFVVSGYFSKVSDRLIRANTISTSNQCFFCPLRAGSCRREGSVAAYVQKMKKGHK